MPRRISLNRLWCGWVVVLLLGVVGLMFGAETPDPVLPPPVAGQEIDFTRDVQPILEANCLRCHGGEKPKSDFSLTTRERALRGGNEGVDIIPGDSASSPLIHYVSGLVEDMEMPPSGRGKPLTGEQIGVLRAWIDQGATWADSPEWSLSGSVTPAVKWISVSGDEGAFREFESMREQWSGGLEQFVITAGRRDGSKVEIEGRALAPDDYKISLTLSRPGLGFVRAGGEQWTRYYDDLGGYNALATPSTYRLGEDLALNIGRAWIDVGLTLPQFPRITIGYEYQYRDGDKSTLQWGLANGRAIYPASKEIDEHVNILKFDFEYDLHGWLIEDNARIEWYQNQTLRNNTLQQSSTSATRVQIAEDGEHVAGANTFRVEKQLTDWWLGSAGYHYSNLSGDSSYNLTTVDIDGVPTFGDFWSAPRIELNSEAHVFSLAGSVQPMRTLAASIGLQNEQSRQSGFGPVNLDFGDPANPFLFPVNVDSNLERSRWSEFANVRFTGIPYTVLFGEARLDQENGSQFEEETGNLPQPLLLRDTDFTSSRGDWKVGVQISQWTFASLNVHYRGLFNDNDYDNLPVSTPPLSVGYSAFIRSRQMDSGSFQALLTLKPAKWIQARLKYERSETDYYVNTDPVTFVGSPGGEINSGTSLGNQYHLSITLKPWRRLGLGAALGYVHWDTTTARNDITSVVDYNGHNWWARGTVAYILSEKDDLHFSYEYWQSDFPESQFATGLPLGSDFSRHSLQVGIGRRWTKNLRSSLRYGFYQFSDPGSGGARNYTAHGIFASLSYKWN